MSDFDQFERNLAAALRSDADVSVAQFEPATIASAAVAVSQRRSLRFPLGFSRRPTSNRWAVAAAAVVAVLIAGALLTTRRDQPVIGNPSPSLPAVAIPSSTPPPSAEVSPPAVQSLELTWTKVALDQPLGQLAWLGDRFVLIDDVGGVSTSTDGASWQVLQPGDPDPGYAELLRGNVASWGDDVVGWWNNPKDEPDVANNPPVTARDILRIVRPPAEPTETTPFIGRIESIGIGPVGIVAQVHSHLDWDAWVATRLGEDWVSHFTDMAFEDGILDISVDNGPGLHVVWADEGFELGDYQDAGFGWYSPDGEQWTAMPYVGTPEAGGRGFATGFGDVVGVSDGFIARGDSPDACTLPAGCSPMWHSSDGPTWRNLGHPEAAPSDGSVLLPWMGGALVSDGVGRFDFWTSQGLTELPMAAELPAAWKQANQDNTRFGSGPLGLVTVGKGDDPEILFTRDGVAWDIQAMPAEMEADQTFPDVIVGDRSVLVVMSSGPLAARIPSLWLGTPEP